MKINDSVRIRDEKSSMVKQANWEDEDISIDLTAWQYEDDEFANEPQGESDMKSYKPEQIVEAFERFLTCVKKGYESIDLTIRSYKSDEVTFTVTIHPKKMIAWATADVSATDKNAEKIAKIQQIVQS